MAQKDGLNDNLFFIKLYTGNIIKETKIPIIKGNKYHINNFINKNKNVKTAKNTKYDLYFKRDFTKTSPHTIKV